MAEERQTNYTIAESFELPSGGKIYSKAVNPRVELRSMTTRDEMKRCNPSNTQFKVLADIIEDCMIEKPAIHVYDMALGDYEYLLHKLRIVTYGDEYKMAVRCPHCGEISDMTAHLNELKIKDFDQTKFEEARVVVLPKSGHTVALKFQTPRMLDEAEIKLKELKRKYKDAEVDFSILVTLTQVIDEVDGEKLNSVKLENFINKLPALDMRKIQNAIDTLNACVGLDVDLFVNCHNCGGDVHTYFRFGQEFFRPTNI